MQFFHFAIFVATLGQADFMVMAMAGKTCNHPLPYNVCGSKAHWVAAIKIVPLDRNAAKISSDDEQSQ